jgi:hypothetical protein
MFQVYFRGGTDKIKWFPILRRQTQFVISFSAAICRPIIVLHKSGPFFSVVCDPSMNEM